MILLIDGNNQAFVSNMAMGLSTKDGFPTQAIHGFFKSIHYYAYEFQPQQIIVAWDGGKSEKRLALMPEYIDKGGRSKKRDAKMEAKFQELKQQFPAITDMCLRLGWTAIVGGEADDALAVAAQTAAKAGVPSVIVSSDKDFYQLVNEHVSIMNPNQKAPVRYITHENFFEAKGMRPDQWLDFRAMMGDPSDGIPGAKGVGEGTAKKIIANFGSPYRLWEEAVTYGRYNPNRYEKNLINDWEGFERSKKMMDLRMGKVLVSENHKVRQPDNIDTEGFKEWLMKLEMLETYSQFEAWVTVFPGFEEVAA